MSWLDRQLERIYMATITRLSGRAAAVLTFVLYPGIGLVLPIVLGWSVRDLVVANVVGTTLAASVSLGWLGLQIQASHRRHLIEWSSNLRLLSAEEFEWFVGEVFRRRGWTVQETGSQDAPDGNIDLRVA